MTRIDRSTERGQMIVLFALVLVVVLLVAGLVVDGGYAWAQRRAAQNAADLAALGGARVVALSFKSDPAGTDANVKTTIDRILKDHGVPPVDWTGTGLDRPRYTSFGGTLLSDYVGAGAIPSAARGVYVPAERTWKPFFLGAISGLPGGVVPSSLTASAGAIARAGYLSSLPAGGVFPIGLDYSSFPPTSTYFGTGPCAVGEAPVSQGGTCPDVTLDDSTHSSGQIGPGNFGWLKFGAQNNCAGYGLGMVTNDGCPNGNPSNFLQGEIDGKSFGCCSAPTGAAFNAASPIDRIGGGQGHNGQGGDDCSAAIASKATYFVPVYDHTGGNGNDYWYHIIGFAGFQITACNGGKNATGVWREQITNGPTQQNPTNGSFSLLATQLVQ